MRMCMRRDENIGYQSITDLRMSEKNDSVEACKHDELSEVAIKPIKTKLANRSGLSN